MKKRNIILTTTVLLVILSVTLLGFTACNKDNGFDLNGFAADAPQKYVQKSEVIKLDDLNGYTNTYSDNGFLFVSGTTDDGKYKYCLYSFAENKILAEGVGESSSMIERYNNENLYAITVADAQGTVSTTFYDAYGEIISFDSKVTVTDNSSNQDLVYAALSDNSYILFDETGKGTHIPYSAGPQLSEMSAIGEYLQIENSSSGSLYLVYDRNLNFVASYDLNEAFNVGSSFSLSNEITAGHKIFRSYTQEITDEEETDYDYLNEYGEKENIIQIVLDASTGKTTTLSNNVIISSTINSDVSDDHFFAYYYEISDKALCKTRYIGLFDENFNLVANVSDIVGYDIGNITSIDKIGEYLVFSGSQYFTFVKDNKVAYKVSASYGSTVVYSRYAYGNYVYFDLFTGKTITQIPIDAVLQSTSYETDGLIYYKLSEEIDNEGSLSYVYRTYVFDVKTGQTTLIDDSDNVTFSTYTYSVNSPETGLSVYDTFSNQKIFSAENYSTIQYNNIPDGILISCKTSEGTVERYVLKRS